LNTIVNRNIIFQILPYFSALRSSRIDPFKSCGNSTPLLKRNSDLHLLRLLFGDSYGLVEISNVMAADWR
jgi:hypothetical protein